MRAKIHSKYQITGDVIQAISDTLRAAGLDPGVTIESSPAGLLITTTEETIPAGVRTQIKAAVLPLLRDTTADPDLTA